MPRRGRASSPMRSSRPTRPVNRVPARAPQHTQPAPMAQAPMAPMAAPRQPGMFAQMATTAAGVAVGSAVGHTLGHAMTSGGGGSEVAAAPEAYQAPAQPQSQGSACQFEFKQFLECTQNQTDISLCQGFNEVFRQCQQANGLAPSSSNY